MRATALAGRIGQGIAFGFGFLGLTGGNPMLVLIAVFVYFAAAAETEGTSLLNAARRMRASEAMISAFESLDTNASLDDAAKALLRTTQHEFPIVDGAGKLRGMLSRQMLVATLAAKGENTPVIEVMETGIPEISADTRLDKVLEAMQAAGRGTAALTGPDGRFAGYISRENLAELTMLTAADWHNPEPRRA